MKVEDNGQGISRRNFFSIVGLGGFMATVGGSMVSLFKYMFPNVLYEPPTVFKIGRPEDYGIGVNEQWKRDGQFWVVKNERGLYVMIAICRHLGCTPNWYADQQLFRCPCHGSIYDINGNVRGGPAPRGFWRAVISLDPVDKQIVVNTAIRHDPDPASTPDGLIVEEARWEVEPYFLKV